MPIHLEITTDKQENRNKTLDRTYTAKIQEVGIELSTVRTNSSKERNVMLRLRLKES